MEEEREESYMTKLYDKDVIFPFIVWIEENVGGWTEMKYKYKTKLGQVLVRECTDDEIEVLRDKEATMADLVKGDG